MRRKLSLLPGLLMAGALHATPLPEVVVVTSALRATDLATAPVSVTVLDSTGIQAASLQHFEELTQLVPNINWSGEGSRARYFQIRGTGELEQYEGAPNPSVGFIVDDIDVSGIGGIATTFDVDHIEVLRGPQGTRYGANALAGLIMLQTAQPTAYPEAHFTATGGSEDTWALGAVVSGPVAVPAFGDSLTYRVAVQQYRSDGFRHNAWLGRDDTANRDELTARAKLRWQPAPDVDVLLTALHVGMDNGYDDFALDNSYTTQSDQPGEDAQTTDAASLRATIGLGGVADLVSISGVARSAIVFGFDADWGNPDYWAPWVYNFAQRFDRHRDTLNQEFRLVSRAGHEVLGADWLVGVYALNLREKLARRDTADCPAATCGEDLIYDSITRSDYEATNLAAYSVLACQLGARSLLAACLRTEMRRARYSDSAGARITPTDRMQGGDLTLTHELAATSHLRSSVWARIARGYKAGGFNPSVADIPEATDRLEFKPEYLWNYELGLRGSSADGRWQASGSVFWQERVDQQLRIPEQFRPGDPTTFLFLTSNAEHGRNTGMELELHWQASPALAIGASLGLLDTDIRRFSARPELEDRELAHAPRYTFAVNGTWQAGGGWFVRADYTGKAGYTIDYCQAADCQDPATAAYGLLDLRAGRTWGAWSVEAWCRNAFDKRHAVRGFYFGNEPPAFEPTLYTRLGDPRQYGLTLEWRL